MKHLLLIAPMAFSFVFFSCAEKEPIVTTLPVSGTQATLEWQNCATFSSQGLTLCFIGADENRCPCNAECLWEGTVEATFHVTTVSGIDTTITLTTNSNPINLPNSTTIGGKTITFVNTDAVSCADYGHYDKYKVIVKVE